MSLVSGEVDPTGHKNLHDAGAFAEIIIFDDDGPEGFYQRKFFSSSYYAANWFLNTFDERYHCKITQTSREQ